MGHLFQFIRSIVGNYALSSLSSHFIILLGRTDIRGCIACETCRKNGKCAFNDIVNELAVKFEEADYEGMQVMRVLAGNMVFLMESIALGKEKIGLPKTEERVWTNFTR